MKLWIFGLCAFFLVLPSCADGSGGDKFYVAAPSELADEFPSVFEQVLEDSGLRVEAGSASSDSGYTLHAIQGRGRRVRVWGQNVPLSAREAEACDLGDEARPAPNRFLVSVEPRSPLGGKQRAAELAIWLADEISAAGFTTSADYVGCTSR
ncbi:hypothetical protein [Parvularcula oceani]|uniref:hypothetical protein n=1 Tax=Parvularcula oceani TaxID=1247963 RepID=UPI0012DC1D54|nr:hypothetical protein [Parvularcula oceani]